MKDLSPKKMHTKTFYADSAYIGKDLHNRLENNDLRLQIHEKGCKNKPLTKAQKANNKAKSRVRVRVEHVFGFMENSMGGMTLWLDEFDL